LLTSQCFRYGCGVCQFWAGTVWVFHEHWRHHVHVTELFL